MMFVGLNFTPFISFLPANSPQISVCRTNLEFVFSQINKFYMQCSALPSQPSYECLPYSDNEKNTKFDIKTIAIIMTWSRCYHSTPASPGLHPPLNMAPTPFISDTTYRSWLLDNLE